MADHHVDSMKNFDYQKAAENILKKHGLFIAGAPAINHKPGNDFTSDIRYPLPNYGDYKSLNLPPSNNTEYIENKNSCNCIRSNADTLINDVELFKEDIENIRNIENPVITYYNDIEKTLIDHTVFPYTGLTLQAVEKKSFDISFLKPKVINDNRQIELHTVEVTTGHLLSIATFDGNNYHIFRGLCIDILKVEEDPIQVRKVIPKSTPWGNPMLPTDENYKDISQLAIPLNGDINKNKQPFDNTVSNLIKRNVRIVLDTSENFKSSFECIPINQILDIQCYNYIYDFTIYEGNLKILWDDWFQIQDKNDNKWKTYVPYGTELPQRLQHCVVEHQYPNIDINL